MPKSISRKLEYADRVAIQQADQAIRRDMVRALVELITNSDDSYHRLEGNGRTSSGDIVIEIQRRHTNSKLRISDRAEGMSGEQLDRKVGRYGEETSGFHKGQRVRGFWGRGLKDAIFGLGSGTITTFCDENLYICKLFMKNGVPTYERDAPIHATQVIRDQFGGIPNNGTIAEIVVSRPDVTTPRFDNLRRSLERHFELRAILGNSDRHVTLRELDPRGRIRQEVLLSYSPPVGKKVLSETFQLPESAANVHLEVYRADEPLSTPDENPGYAEGGFLVMSKHIVLDQTLFKFEGDAYAARFYGKIRCDYLYELLREDSASSIATATRDGINWKHPVTRALKAEVERRLQPIIDEERRNAQNSDRSEIEEKLKSRLNRAIKELNSIAQNELGGLGDMEGNGSSSKVPFVPASGFGFVPEYISVQSGKPATLVLRATIPQPLANGSLISLESDNTEVELLTPQVILEELSEFPGVGQAHVQVEGHQVGAESIIVAFVDGLKTEAMVRVISQRKIPEPVEPRGHGALFREVKFDVNPDVKQRAWFDRQTSTIRIAIKVPSVAPYILDETGRGTETPQGQVMLAELVSEAVCREIARRGVESGNYPSVSGSEADSVQREFIRLQMKYAHIIHNQFVDPTFRA